MTNDDVFCRLEEEVMLRNYSKRTLTSYKRTAVEFLHFAGKSNFEESQPRLKDVVCSAGITL